PPRRERSWPGRSRRWPSGGFRSGRSCARSEEQSAYSGGMVGPRIVIVEDDAELRGVLKRGLEEEGFRAETAATGGQLLERLAPTARSRPRAFGSTRSRTRSWRTRGRCR